MTKKQEVHNLIILDESGSMESIKDSVITGFNEIVQTVKGIQEQFPDQEHFISLIAFNGLGTHTLHFAEAVKNLNLIDKNKYSPNASTPLFDAMGFGIHKLRQHLDGREQYNVLVTIFTDGEENASVEYSGEAIKKLVDDLKQKRWTFTYIGTDHDVDKMAARLSIVNVINFRKSAEGLGNFFATESSARHRYSAKINLDEEVSEDFYKEGK